MKVILVLLTFQINNISRNISNNFTVIDGHHRLEKAYRNGIEKVMAYKLTPEQFIPFLTTVKGYESFVEYWNGKLKEENYNVCNTMHQKIVGGIEN